MQHFYLLKLSLILLPTIGPACIWRCIASINGRTASTPACCRPALTMHNELHHLKIIVAADFSVQGKLLATGRHLLQLQVEHFLQLCQGKPLSPELHLFRALEEFPCFPIRKNSKSENLSRQRWPSSPALGPFSPLMWKPGWPGKGSRISEQRR